MWEGGVSGLVKMRLQKQYVIRDITGLFVDRVALSGFGGASCWSLGGEVLHGALRMSF